MKSNKEPSVHCAGWRISGEIRMLIDVYSAVPYRNLSHTAGYPQKNAFQAFKAANGNDC